MNNSRDIQKAKRSLTGLSVGDAFGEQFFHPGAKKMIDERQLPPGVWSWTDDTHMAISIVEILQELGEIDQDILAQRLAARSVLEQGTCFLKNLVVLKDLFSNKHQT